MVILKNNSKFVKVRQRDVVLIDDMQYATTFNNLTYKDKRLIERDLGNLDTFEEVKVKLICI